MPSPLNRMKIAEITAKGLKGQALVNALGRLNDEDTKSNKPLITKKWGKK